MNADKADKREQTLSDILNLYAESNPARFHMPAHKGFSCDPMLKAICPFDVTELNVTDDLYRSDGALKRLRARFASFYSAKASFLLVNGATAGNIAMLLSLGSGKRMLLGRDCHCSALSGIALADHKAVSVFPDAKKGVITAETVEKVFQTAEAPFEAVFLTSPNYYGKVLDIERIAKMIHSHGALLFIDAAHGAHFPYSELLPENPSCADAWVVSCHKTLGSLTQTAVLNLGFSNPSAPEKMLEILSLIQTSSPSFILMRSLENALDRPFDWNAHIKRLIAFRKRLNGIKGLSVEGNRKLFSSFRKHLDFDLTRLVFSFAGINGFALNKYLEERGIYAEMSDAESVVLITSPADPAEWYERLYNALSEFSDTAAKDQSSAYGNAAGEKAGNPQITDSVLKAETNISDFDFPHIQKTGVREALLGNSHNIPLSEADGKICARAVGVYPPGTAILFPGEEIAKTAVSVIQRYKEMGAELFGLENDMISVLRLNSDGETEC